MGRRKRCVRVGLELEYLELELLVEDVAEEGGDRRCDVNELSIVGV
jgi:hypothetical protein